MKEFKIEFSDDNKIKLVYRDRAFVFEETNDGFMLSPDWTSTNRHLTVLPNSAKDSKTNADYNVHLTEPGDDGEKRKIADKNYWVRDVLTEIYSVSRGQGRFRHVSELEGEELLLMDMDSMEKWMRRYDLLRETDDGQRVDFEELSQFIPADVEELEEFDAEEELSTFLSETCRRVSVEEAYESEELFVFNPETGGLLWLFPTGTVVEYTLESLWNAELGAFRGWELFEAMFEEEDVVE